MWIGQQTDWPNFNWNKTIVEPVVRQTRLNQGILLGKMFGHYQDEKASLLDTLLANIVHSSAI